MSRADSGRGTAPAGPASHRQCIAVGMELQRQGQPDVRPWVQVRRYDRAGPYVLCARVLELGGNGVELFKVQTETDGPVWVESRNVGMCSGDGLCACEAANRRPPC